MKEVSPVHWHENKKDLQKYLAKVSAKYTQVICITDENVYTAQREIFTSLKSVSILQISPGEKNKNMKTALHISQKMAEQGMDRKSLLIGVGGGIVTDITAFVASIYQRGIDVLLVPTSLLGMVDASIGAKTGVNTAHGKNQLGTFYTPVSVEICTEFLETLPEAEIKNGLAEMLKHGIIASEKHFSALEKIINQGFTWRDIIPFIKDSQAIKLNIVMRDKKEKSGERMKLNLGHTFGHAIETLSEYEISHGEAIAHGLMFAAEYSCSLGKMKSESVERIKKCVRKLFPQECPYSRDQLWEVFKSDKKRSGETISLILPETLGKVFVYKTEV